MLLGLLPLVACVYVPPVWDIADPINRIDQVVVGEMTQSEVVELLGPPNFTDKPEAELGETETWFIYNGRQSDGEVIAYGGGGSVNERSWWVFIAFDSESIATFVSASKTDVLAHFVPERVATRGDVVAALGEPQMANGEQFYLYTCLVDAEPAGTRLWRNLCRGSHLPGFRLKNRYRFEFDAGGILASLTGTDYLVAPAVLDAAAKRFLPQPERCNVYAIFDVGAVMMGSSLGDLWLNIDREPVSPIVPDGYYTMVALSPGHHELAVARVGYSRHVLPLECAAGAMVFVEYRDRFSFRGTGSTFALMDETEGRDAVLGGERVLDFTYVEKEDRAPSFEY